MAVNDLTRLPSDGTRLGQTTADKIGFFGLTTPIPQPAHTDQGAITAGATTTACNTLANRLRTDLVALGIIKGSI